MTVSVRECSHVTVAESLTTHKSGNALSHELYLPAGNWLRSGASNVRSLNNFLKLKSTLNYAKWLYFTRVWKMDIHRTVRFSLRARFDLTYPKGVHVGCYSYVAFDAVILAHDMTRGLYLHTRVGEHCFIGSRSIILPGIQIGNHCIVGSGSVVTKDVPSGCVVAGNPAKIIHEGLELERYGRFKNAEETKQRLVAAGAFE